MMETWTKRLESEKAKALFAQLYGGGEGAYLVQKERYLSLLDEYRQRFGEADVRFFSSPGRTEIGGNHTDHNHGRVLAAAVTLDMVACAAKTDDGIVTLYSRGYENPFRIRVDDLTLREEEKDTTYALLRGIAYALKEKGRTIGGFNAVMASDVFSGSGLSSSAAVEVLLCTIMDALYNEAPIDAVSKAKLCQFVENVYFGKPSGLMDQSACAVGGLIAIDFGGDQPVFDALSYDFDKKGYAVVVLSARSSHDDLTPEYASIPAEMKAVAQMLGAEVLRDADEADFLRKLPAIREALGDRACLRALHFFRENERVPQQVAALKRDDLPAFLSLIRDSGDSSWKWLQNLYVGGSAHQSLALACALSQDLLGKDGAYRVHGGGFAGTTLNFVPHDKLSAYVSTMNAIFGEGACTVLGIRPQGATEVVL